MGKNWPKISACMIVKNSAPILARSIESFRKYVDEIVVVDTGSTDGTEQIARELGAKVEVFTWTQNFSAARNFSISIASGDYILVMDDDFELSADGGEKLKPEILKNPDEVAFRLKLKTENTESASIYPIILLWKNYLGIKYVRPVHETVDFSECNIEVNPADLKILDIVVFHHHKSFEGKIDQRSERNFKILHNAVQEDPGDITSYYYLGTEYNVRRQTSQAVQCFLKVVEHYRMYQIHELHELRFSILPYTYSNLIASLGALGKCEVAINFYNEGSMIFPAFAELHYLAGICYQESGDDEAAIKKFNQTIKEKPGSDDYHSPSDLKTRAFKGMGVSYFSLGRTLEAEEAFRKALSLEPLNLDATRNLAFVLSKRLSQDKIFAEIEPVSKLDKGILKEIVKNVLG